VPEHIYKLQPDRTVHLRGFDSFASAASIHSATPAGFEVSGTFRDAADFAVAVLYDADNFFEHPSIKYLPDFDFSGLTLNFRLRYTDAVQPIDSPKFNWIDWATLDCIRADGSTAKVSLWDNAMLDDGVFPAASASFHVLTSGSVQPFDRLTLWYQNLAFDYNVPPGSLSLELQFYAGITGATHSATINGRTYTHIEAAGENSSDQAAALAALIGTSDPEVTASALDYKVELTVRPAAVGQTILVTASDGNPDAVMYKSSPEVAAAWLVRQINSFDWLSANTTHGILAANNGSAITVTAARYGSVSVDETFVAWVSGARFSGLMPGSAIVIAGSQYTVASIQSPVRLTLSSAAPPSADVPYLAPRGGRDGNMIRLYSLSKASTLSFEVSEIQLTGGSSDVAWNCSIDFSALGIDQLRQCWLTFAPALANGSAFTAAEWQATFSNWQLTGPEPIKTLQVAGRGSVRIEETDLACVYTGNWRAESGFYSKYFAKAASDEHASVTIAYSCQSPHDLYVGTSIYGTSASSPDVALVTDTLYSPSLNGNFYSDRAVAGVQLDGDAETLLDCRLPTGSALVTRRRLRSFVPAGKHTVTIRIKRPGIFFFDFLEAAVLSGIPAAHTPRTSISPALDFDTDHTYKLAPARLMWIMDQLGYAGPMNEYLGVFWWNERTAEGGSVSTAQVAFTGPFADGDSVILKFNPSDPGGARLGKSVFPTDTPGTIAKHFAAYINGALVGAWASAGDDGILTIRGRSPGPPYNLVLSVEVVSVAGRATITPEQPSPGVYPRWVVNDTASPPFNRAARDWHADFYAQCAARDREVVTASSMELVNPPDGYVARFPDPARTAVSTATGFGALNSNHCAIGSAKMIAYQKAVYRHIAQMQTTAGLIPSVQYGELLWWFLSRAQNLGYASYTSPISIGTATAHGLNTGERVIINGVLGNTAANGEWTITITDPDHFTLNDSSGNGTYTGGGTITGGGMAFYDDETMAAAETALGRPLHVFRVPDDNPSVNGESDAIFLRNRLRDHLRALVTDIRAGFPGVRCELLWPYDVNYPVPVPLARPYLGGRLNRFVNLPPEWQAQSSSGLDCIKVEALAFATGMRNLNLIREAIGLFHSFGWPLGAVRYLVPVFGSATPWWRELALVRSAGIQIVNFWAFDHVCLFNLDVPERALERRSILKVA
jgi:hypothetical protein